MMFKNFAGLFLRSIFAGQEHGPLNYFWNNTIFQSENSAILNLSSHYIGSLGELYENSYFFHKLFMKLTLNVKKFSWQWNFQMLTTLSSDWLHRRSISWIYRMNEIMNFQQIDVYFSSRFSSYCIFLISVKSLHLSVVKAYFNVRMIEIFQKIKRKWIDSGHE